MGPGEKDVLPGTHLRLGGCGWASLLGDQAETVRARHADTQARPMDHDWVPHGIAALDLNISGRADLLVAPLDGARRVECAVVPRGTC